MPLVSLSMKAVTWLSGSAPMKPSAGRPPANAITAGIDWMPIWPGICGCSSMFILTSFTLPFAARTAFSRIGVSCLQGPHHGAQKSISTGWRFDSSMTSCTNVWVVVSLIRSPAGGGVAPLPSSIVTSVLANFLRGWSGPRFHTTACGIDGGFSAFFNARGRPPGPCPRPPGRAARGPWLSGKPPDHAPRSRWSSY